jgi:hypothetical protein
MRSDWFDFYLGTVHGEEIIFVASRKPEHARCSMVILNVRKYFKSNFIICSVNMAEEGNIRTYIRSNLGNGKKNLTFFW